MSKYQKELIKHINENPEFIKPESRKNGNRTDHHNNNSTRNKNNNKVIINKADKSINRRTNAMEK